MQNNLRLAILMEMLEEVSRATEPEQAVQSYASRIGKVRPVEAVIAVSLRNLPPGFYKVTRKLLAEAPGQAPRHLITNPWKNWNQIPAHTGGFLGEIVATPIPRLIHDLYVRNDPVLGDSIADMGSCVAIPVFDGGKVLNWTLQFRRDAQGFTQEELETNLLTGNLFGAMTRNLVALEQIGRLNEKLNQQFEEVARVQQSLLPSTVPIVPGVEFAASYLTSTQAGGDYYDFFDLGDGLVGIVVADVSGHGAGAATVMAMLHAILHSYPETNKNPAAVMKFVNQRLLAAQIDNSFVTAIFAVYDPKTRELVLARAGHPLPRVREADGRVWSLNGEAGLPLGILEEYEIENHRITLRPGQSVVLYTDGLTEAFGPPPRRDMFGVDGLDAAIRAAGAGAEPGEQGWSARILESVQEAVLRHTRRKDREDDQTLVVMSVTGLDA